MSDNKTLGEARIRTDFNIAGSSEVDNIKLKSAALIDICQSMKLGSETLPEKLRLISLAQTSYEEAAMWAVKASTF